MNVFLSASVPLPSRNRLYFETADVVAIRDAIKALAYRVLEQGSVTFGGHPAITPLLALILREAFADRRGSVVLYQSEFFSKRFPTENDEFIDVRIIPEVDADQARSLHAMRVEMLSHRAFDAAVFIGGMEGILDEYTMLREIDPNVPCYPVASTGGACLSLYQRYDNIFDRRLADELTYQTLFNQVFDKIDES